MRRIFCVFLAKNITLSKNRIRICEIKVWQQTFHGYIYAGAWTLSNDAE
jgi:hypothetical protein